MKKIKLRCPATTANVGPGYDIFALALKEPYDEYDLELTNENQIVINFIDDKQNLPASVEDNTAGLAIMELKKRFSFDKGVKLIIHKKMPSGCGLGTTGAAAAASVYGLNQLLNLGLSNDEMIDIARIGEIASGGSPHADNVSAALLGGFVLVKSYNPINVLRLKVPEFPIVLAVIKKSQRTTRGFITYEIGQEKLKEQMARCARVIHAIHAHDIEEFGKAVSVDYIAEPVRASVISYYHETKSRLLDAGAYGVNISGGGSSVFAVCPPNKIDEISSIMKKGFGKNQNFISIIKTTTSNRGVIQL